MGKLVRHLNLVGFYLNLIDSLLFIMIGRVNFVSSILDIFSFLEVAMRHVLQNWIFYLLVFLQHKEKKVCFFKFDLFYQLFGVIFVVINVHEISIKKSEVRYIFNLINRSFFGIAALKILFSVVVFQLMRWTSRTILLVFKKKIILILLDNAILEVGF